MERLRMDTVTSLHRAMVVLREELETKNKIIMKLRRKQRYKYYRDKAGNFKTHQLAEHEHQQKHEVC